MTVPVMRPSGAGVERGSGRFVGAGGTDVPVVGGAGTGVAVLGGAGSGVRVGVVGHAPPPFGRAGFDSALMMVPGCSVASSAASR